MIRKPVWKRLFQNNKGLTLLESVVAISVIAVVSIGITTLVFSLSRISKLSEEQMRLNAVSRIIKENVTLSARDISKDIPGTSVKASDLTSAGDTHSNLAIEDFSGQEYSYVFDLTYEGISSDGVKKYTITVKQGSSGLVTFKFMIEVYTG